MFVNERDFIGLYSNRPATAKEEINKILFKPGQA